MLRWRLISAAILLATFISLIWLDVWLGSDEVLGRSGVILLPCAIAFGVLSSYEVLAFGQTTSTKTRLLTASCTAIVILASFVPLLWDEYPKNCSVGSLGWTLLALAGVVGLAFVSQMIRYQPEEPVTQNVMTIVFVSAYLGVLISFWAPLRRVNGNDWGIVAFLSLLVTVKLSDTMAYAVGKLVGRRKLAPILSPGKTVEGVFGGLMGGFIGALLVFYLLAPWITGQSTAASFWHVLVFAVLATLVGIAGDLAVSLLKRDGGVKNSSQWLPGLGGIMDISDSVLAASPAVYALWLTGWFDAAPV